MVEKKKRSIHWDIEAKLYFKQAIQYIKQESPQGANIVKKAILEHVSVLKLDAGIYEADRFKIGNDGTYRAVTVYSYRITYRVTNSQILILRIRHTSQNPILY
ncbi:MAG: plasmid stabilization protein [Bacteroidetes bacterium B1(2017)]|nr:MAG: plasmid stabilization protein [Bacteroidetes bacterium B1(2017)]